MIVKNKHSKYLLVTISVLFGAVFIVVLLSFLFFRAIESSQTNAAQLYQEISETKGKKQAEEEVVSSLKRLLIVKDVVVSESSIWITYRGGMRAFILTSPPGSL